MEIDQILLILLHHVSSFVSSVGVMHEDFYLHVHYNNTKVSKKIFRN